MTVSNLSSSLFFDSFFPCFWTFFIVFKSNKAIKRRKKSRSKRWKNHIRSKMEESKIDMSWKWKHEQRELCCVTTTQKEREREECGKQCVYARERDMNTASNTIIMTHLKYITVTCSVCVVVNTHSEKRKNKTFLEIYVFLLRRSFLFCELPFSLSLYKHMSTSTHPSLWMPCCMKVCA